MPYITRIRTTELRGIPPLDIGLEPAEGEPFRHLVLTGPNGTGKTSILGAIATEIFADIFLNHKPNDAALRQIIEQSLDGTDDLDSENGSLDLGDGSKSLVRDLVYRRASLTWSPPLSKLQAEARQSLMFSYLPARRGIEVRTVAAISTEQKRKPGRGTAFKANAPHFLQFLVNRKAQQSFARDDGDEATANHLDAWFTNLERSLTELFGEDQLRLEFDRRALTFHIKANGHRYNLLGLAHGHAAALGILAEVLMRVELSRDDADHSHDSGVVLIDEPEMHLHLELQERILPALVKMFPHVQFIVATHSPVVVSSIENAIVFDLEDRKPRHSEDLRGRPYGWIMKRHFGLEEDFDLATTELLHELDTLRRLASPTPEQQARLEELAEQLSGTSHALALEVWNRVLASRLERREARGKAVK